MRRLSYILPVLLFAALVWYLGRGLTRDPSSLPSVLIDHPAPAFSLQPLAVAPEATLEPITDKALGNGRVWLVNFFASWCAPCKTELPVLAKLAARGVPILGVAYQDDPKKALAWLEKNRQNAPAPYALTVADRTGRTAIDWGVYKVPETYVIDGDRRIRYRHSGALSQQDVEDTIIPLLRQLGGAPP